jgi:assimilatory nitrate reductase catalytic subunit
VRREAEQPVKTTCPYCGVGCGVLAKTVESGVEIAGDPQHPANFGRLCSKGSALGETLGIDDRLLHPSVGGVRKTWDEALSFVAQGFQKTISAHGPESVAFYVSGQLLTEDYYVSNKLMKGFIGTANIDTNSRLCMASAVAGHKRAFGEDLVPVSYEDLELADLIVLVGSNTAWCHPVIFQRITAAKKKRPEMKVVVIDPRRTATCELADLHLPVKSGTDVWLFNGLLSFLHEHGVVDAAFVAAHTTDASRALAVAANTAGDVKAVAKICGVDAGRLGEFYALFACTGKTVTAFSQGVNQSSSGTDKVNSIINCHLLTGRIGKPGMGPFSITGQPNAMGGREVGGMANMLAAHLDFVPGQRALVQEFWGSPRIAEKPGLKAVDLFEAIHAGRIKAVWIMATNPVVSLPDANRVREALKKCELVVISDCIAATDTTVLAHVLLPAAAWGEKEGTVTNSERRISRQRAFLPPPGDAKPDWWMLSEVARHMGFGEHFNYASAHEIFEEHARLSAFKNQESGVGGQESGESVPRYFNLSGLSELTRAQYDDLKPVRWPAGKRVPSPLRGEGQDGGVGGPSSPPQPSPLEGEGEINGAAHLFAEGRFYHPDGKARFVPTPPRAPQHVANEEFPLLLNTGRIRDQWHTMTRSGKSPRLASHLPEPYVDLHPQDAMLCGVRQHELARVSTSWGSLVARAKFSGEMRRGQVFVPIHWNGQTASDARVGALVNPVVDPISGEPEFKHTPARVEEFRVHWHGFVFTRRALDMTDAAWWTRVQGHRYLRYELAGPKAIANPAAWARRLLAVRHADADWLDYSDASAGIYRAAHVENDRIESSVFVSPRADLPSRAWVAGLFDKEKLEDLDRIGLLIGAPAMPQTDTGATVCSCFGVGRKTIAEAIRKNNLTTTQQIGQCLKAGTNCGSCLPEIKIILAEQRLAA